MTFKKLEEENSDLNFTQTDQSIIRIADDCFESWK